MKMRPLCYNIWSSIFKSLFLKGASTHTRVLFLFEQFCVCVWGGVSRRWTYWKKEFCQKKKFLMETDKSTKAMCVGGGDEFCRHRCWLVHHMRLLVTCSLRYFFVQEIKLISLRCWTSKFALWGKKVEIWIHISSFFDFLIQQRLLTTLYLS